MKRNKRSKYTKRHRGIDGFIKECFGKILPKPLSVKDLFPYSPIHLLPSKKVAFTLAETLITLGIIGVVAALTLPVISAKINRNILNQQFKKSYSVLSNAFNSTLYDMDFDTNCFYVEKEDHSNGGYVRSGCYTFWTENFVKKLKVIKVCEGNAFSDGCVPDYNLTASSGCPWFNSDFIKSNGYSVVTNDGMIIFPYNCAPCKFSAPIIGFDVNGKKGPNKPGFDVYSLSIRKSSNNTFILSGSNAPLYNYIVGCLPYGRGAVYSFDQIMK